MLCPFEEMQPTLWRRTDLPISDRTSRADITTIVKLSAFIKGKAASHVEHLAKNLEKPEVAYGQEVSACC